MNLMYNNNVRRLLKNWNRKLSNKEADKIFFFMLNKFHNFFEYVSIFLELSYILFNDNVYYQFINNLSKSLLYKINVLEIFNIVNFFKIFF